MMAVNPEAARLRLAARGRFTDRRSGTVRPAFADWEADFEAALAAERRLTVERIKERLLRYGYDPIWRDMATILDQVAEGGA